MRQRAISAVGVAIVGIVPALLGGPVFAATIAILCLIGVREYSALAARIGAEPSPADYLVVVAAAVAALAHGGAEAVLGVVALALGLPLVLAILRSEQKGAFLSWGLNAAGALYLGVPVFAAVSIREIHGTTDARWLNRLADALAFTWNSAPRGLAWLLIVVLATWMNDTFAYVVGRAIGRHLLIPRVSPKKTVEGLVGGLVAAAVTGAVGVAVFGLGVNVLIGVAVGLVLGIVGVFGDLAESVFKRQAGVKDSGTLIPGHGGILDRLDALLFTFTAGWFLATLVDRIA